MSAMAMTKRLTLHHCSQMFFSKVPIDSFLHLLVAISSVGFCVFSVALHDRYPFFQLFPTAK